MLALLSPQTTDNSDQVLGCFVTGMVVCYLPGGGVGQEGGEDKVGGEGDDVGCLAQGGHSWSERFREGSKN